MFKTFILSLLISAQPAHISFTGAECFPETGIIKVVVKLDYNDFVFDYRNTINDDQGFDPTKEIDTTAILVRKYLNNQIKIYADDKQVSGQLTKIESDNGELKMYLTYSYNKNVKRFKVKNSILTDIYKNQCNLLIFKYNDFEEGVKLTPMKKEHIFNMK